MNAWWAPWGALLRRARRLALRSPWRTAWTALLVVVAVGVAGVAMSAIWGNDVATTSTERTMGAADVIYRGTVPVGAATELQDALQSSLPDRSEVAVEQTVTGLVLTAGDGSDGADERIPGGVYGLVRMADWEDPLLEGVLQPVEGRRPRAGEVVLNPELAEWLDLGIGDRLRVDASDSSLAVVGIAIAGPEGTPVAAVAPGELVSRAPAGPGPEVDATAFVGLPAGAVAPEAAELSALDSLPVGAELSGPYGRPESGGDHALLVDSPGSRVDAVAVMLVGLVAVVGLLAGASSGLGARRRLRASGLLAANGADRGQLAAAAAAEMLVIAVPATAVGLLVSWLGGSAWVSMRLDGWPVIVDAAFDWRWVAPLVVGAVVASVSGAILFSRPARRLSASDLLDSRVRAPMVSAAGRTPAWIGWILLGWLAWTMGTSVVGGIGGGGGWLGITAALVLMVLWLGCATTALRMTTVFLGRDPVGRVVDRDLRHRRVGSIATVVIVATWVFAAVAVTATADYGRTVRTDETSSTGEQVTVATYPAAPGAGTSTLIQGAIAQPASDPAGEWELRGSGRAPGSAGHAAGSVRLPDGLADELAEAGLPTAHATVGEWTGPCAICPSGFTPTVLVLDSAEGIGLSPSTVDLLNAGNAVTPFDMDGIEDQTVGGVPVRVGSVPAGAQAAVLASATSEGLELVDRRPTLVGSTAGLSDAQIRRIIDIADAEELSIGFDDPRLDMLRPNTSAGELGKLGNSRQWVIWPSVVVLLVVALTATAAHRREHGEAARVLQVLGARRRSARRLASLTAGTLTATGVVLGLTAALMLVTAMAVRSGPGVSVPWNREATLVLVVSLVLPMVVALLARLIPSLRSIDGPDGPMPA